MTVLFPSIPPTLGALVLFLAGVALVVESVERFVESVAESALSLGFSAFFLTVVLAGTDLENAILGLAAVFGRLPDLALGTVFGEALFILGVALGIAGILSPFETTVPRSYLLLTVGSPALFFLLAADGTVSRLDGGVLTLAFLPLLGAVYVLERHTDTQYLSAEEVADRIEADGNQHASPDGGPSDADSDERVAWWTLAVTLLAVVGMTVGSELAVIGARDVLATLGISGLAFGATVMSFVASLEELFLTVEPVRQGRPHLGIGNVVGSMLFFVTANVGVLALVHPLTTDGAVVTVHWPFFLGSLALVGAILFRGRVGRPEGALLLAVYVGYWAANGMGHLVG
ncbi:sodium:calcium antiporter [Halorientalis brevis]|uniref:Sodium:calcium antiporter n=1 Tax=Halorientalis brevis TaxID=1126241 RepID=A0ABD6CGE8_9EURY|nr:sodium:calcium antiporter [Halorientalis brevis]